MGRLQGFAVLKQPERRALPVADLVGDGGKIAALIEPDKSTSQQLPVSRNIGVESRQRPPFIASRQAGKPGPLSEFDHRSSRP